MGELRGLQGRKIWTVGHSSRSAEALVMLLREAGIELVVDVRSSPWSRRHPWHGRDELEKSLKAAGISYRWLGHVLGGLREEGYDAYRQSAEYAAGLDELIRLSEQRTAIACAERDYRKCHRHYIADDLVARGLRVWHLLDPGQITPHQMTLDLF